jgi:hypothetical protein
MKKLLFFLLILNALMAKAQQDVGGFLHVTMGVSLPQSDFASKDLNNPAAGYAHIGFTTNALFGHKIHNKWGAYVMLSLTAHAVDKEALSATINQRIPGYTWSVNPAFWSVSGLIFGPQFSHNFKKAAVDFRLGTGALNFISPALDCSGISTSGNQTASFKQQEVRASSLVLSAGFTYKYEIKWGWVLLFNADYFSASPTFNGIEQVLSEPGLTPDTREISYQKAFRMLQGGMGLGYVF